MLILMNLVRQWERKIFFIQNKFCTEINQKVNYSGAKTVPRIYANKNTPYKNDYFMYIYPLKLLKKCYNMIFKYREGGRTVGSGKVAKIIE